MNATTSNSNVCCKCNRNFARFSVLRKHVKKFHPDQLEEIAPLKAKSYAFTCEMCKKNFSAKKSFKWHLKTHVQQDDGLNNSEIIVQNVRKKCSLCDFVSRFKDELHEHFKVTHGINIKTSNMNFSSAEQFNSWFSKTEKETQTKFVIERRSMTTKAVYASYVCHRSGFFKSKSSGKRHLKAQGSKKINGFCPARIQVTINKDCDTHKVSFVETHVGHQNDLCHLFLSDIERDMLAAKISMKVPFDEILNDARDTISKNSMERIHLLKKKDLFNIQACFNLCAISERHKNGAVSVDPCVEEIVDSCILFYKPQENNGTAALEIVEQTKPNNESENVFDQVAGSSTSNIVDEEELLDKKKQLVENVSTEIFSIQSEKQFKEIEKVVASIGPKLRALQSTEPNIKNIVKQRRRVSTKKTPKKVCRKLSKPSESKANEIALNLLL